MLESIFKLLLYILAYRICNRVFKSDLLEYVVIDIISLLINVIHAHLHGIIDGISLHLALHLFLVEVLQHCLDAGYVHLLVHLLQDVGAAS